MIKKVWVLLIMLLVVGLLVFFLVNNNFTKGKTDEVHVEFGPRESIITDKDVINDLLENLDNINELTGPPNEKNDRNTYWHSIRYYFQYRL